MDAFDQSFEYFQDGTTGIVDPWSGISDKPSELNYSLESSKDNVDSADLFDFSVSSQGREPQPQSPTFPTDPIWTAESSAVQVVIHEQMSAFYDDLSADPACQIEGWISVRPQQKAPFCLVLRDLMTHVDKVEIQSPFCQDISVKTSRKGLHPADRVLRVTPEVAQERVSIASYRCVSRLRPVPLVRKIHRWVWKAAHRFPLSHTRRPVDQEPRPRFGKIEPRWIQDSGQSFQSTSAPATGDFAGGAADCRRHYGTHVQKGRRMG